jgi:hypothetical protein
VENSKKRKGAAVDKASIVIVKVEAAKYGEVIVEISDGVRYYSDLLSLSRTYCYPKNFDQWQRVSIDSYGLALVWESRFEAHIDQIIGLATKKEKMAKLAFGS